MLYLYAFDSCSIVDGDNDGPNDSNGSSEPPPPLFVIELGIFMLLELVMLPTRFILFWPFFLFVMGVAGPLGFLTGVAGGIPSVLNLDFVADIVR
jgi:hypothetical protein